MKTGIFFPNLNGLRFLAAFMVILHHFELARGINMFTIYGRFANGIGKLGVILFFTLSGFLITFLLLTEKKETQTISIREFYIRRILRIWPLYYFIVCGALYLFNNVMYLRIPGISNIIQSDFLIKNMLFIGMLPNIAYAYNYSVPYANQAWSIGVEEQFYLFWPILFKYNKNPYRVILLVITTYLSLKFSTYLLMLFYQSAFVNNLYLLVSVTSFDSMAIGALFAIIVFEKNKKVLNFLFNKSFQAAFIGLLIISLVLSLNIGFFNFEFYSILFGLIIINLAANEHVIFSLENSTLNYLGKISFGLYMYHFIAIRMMDIILIRKPIINHWMQLLIVVLITIMLSTISYFFMEKYFIKKKLGYSKIFSGDNLSNHVNALQKH